MVNKSDRNDARGIAQMVRANLIRPVHVKTVSSQEKRMLLTSRKFMLKQLCDAEGNLRGMLRNFGLKVGPVTRRVFEARILDLVAERPALARVVEPMLRARAALLAEFNRLHKVMLDTVRADPVCRRLMTVPGVGPVTALNFPGDRRCACALHTLTISGRALRADAAQMAIRGDRPHGANLQMRRRDDALSSLRGRQYHD